MSQVVGVVMGDNLQVEADELGVFTSTKNDMQTLPGE